jgi:hypothetical protein
MAKKNEKTVLVDENQFAKLEEGFVTSFVVDDLKGLKKGDDLIVSIKAPEIKGTIVDITDLTGALGNSGLKKALKPGMVTLVFPKDPPPDKPAITAPPKISTPVSTQRTETEPIAPQSYIASQ